MRVPATLLLGFFLALPALAAPTDRAEGNHADLDVRHATDSHLEPEIASDSNHCPSRVFIPHFTRMLTTRILSTLTPGQSKRRSRWPRSLQLLLLPQRYLQRKSLSQSPRREAPAAKAPVANKPAAAPVANKPAANAPVAQKPAAKAPVAKKPVAQKPASKVATATKASPSAKPSAKSCTAFKGATKAKTPTSAKFRTVKARAVGAKQFHATCKTFAASIESAIKAGTFALQPERIWPNEFTWSGGFYVTPDEQNAQLFGATFLANNCKDKGGVVVLGMSGFQLSLDTSGLEVKDVGTNKVIVNKFRADQARLGGAFQRFLKKNLAPEPPADQGISADDNPAVQAPLIPLPTPEQIEQAKQTKNALNTVNLKTFEDFKTVDVVAGAGPFAASQRVLIEDASNPEVGIPPLSEPFNQVVLVTDKGKHAFLSKYDMPGSDDAIAMGKLRFVGQNDLDACLAEKQPKLLAFLKKKGAAT
ncbi:hypothetical protein C8J57DRAFT_1232614 [Mycena rebaudengoi]|nr:hypothetical protein C8J57DRAFT_1232614 [Mycena rebaudengoi]